MEENKAPVHKEHSGIIERLWQFFSSTRLAFILMIVIALLSLLGALISQYSGPKELYQSWMENTAQPQYGLWTPLMGLLQLFRVFHSVWFLGAGALLVINILVCSLDRWKRLNQMIRGGKIVQIETYYQTAGSGLELNRMTDSASEAMDSVIAKLKAQGYRVRKELSGERIHIAADKNRYFRLGTYLTHFSLILFILGFLISGFLGFRNDSFTVAVGGVENVGDNSGLSLKLLSFQDQYYPDGSPKDFRSEVVVYENSKQVKQGSIQVNHPLVYKSYSFFQSSFGQSVLVQIKDSSGRTLSAGNIPLTEPLNVETLHLITGGIEIPGAGVAIWAMKAASGGGGGMLNEGELIIQVIDQSTQQILKMGKVSKGVPTSLSGFEISYLGDSQFSGFQVARDPGANFIWAASALLLAGLVMVFYFPLRQLWAVAIPAGPKSSRVLLRTTAARTFSTPSDLAKLVKQIESTTDRDKKIVRG